MDSINSTMQLGLLRLDYTWPGLIGVDLDLIDNSVMKVDLGKIKCSFHKLNQVIGVD